MAAGVFLVSSSFRTLLQLLVYLSMSLSVSPTGLWFCMAFLGQSASVSSASSSMKWSFPGAMSVCGGSPKSCLIRFLAVSALMMG